MGDTLINSFRDFSLPEGLQKSIEQLGFKTPTPVQAKAIPVVLTNRDLIASAQTGTGKTAAFCIPIITKLEKNPNKAALMLVPTREIATQIGRVLEGLTRFLPKLSTATLVGGVTMSPQLKSLSKHPRIVIATPGRLVDHLRRGSISLFKTDILVLDEADRMLDMGFSAQLNEILRFLPSQRQTLLFSATMPPDIQKLAARYQKDPVRISIGPVSKPVEEILQSVIQTSQAQKNEILIKELNSRQGSVLIFTRTKYRTDRLAKHLSTLGLDASRIHGGRTQGQRNSAIEGFRHGKFRILVATDIAARGIDIPHIAHVINYDLPKCTEDYVHRIGRTARAGANGCALSLVAPEERGQWKDISKRFGTH